MSPAGSLTSADPVRVELLCDLERWEDALPLVSRLLAAEPENDVAWCLLAQCHLGLGRSEPALIAAGRAAALTPDNEWPYRLMSFAATNLGRHDEAVRAAREAVRLEPEAWQTHARLAAAAVRQSGRRPGRWSGQPGRRDARRPARRDRKVHDLTVRVRRDEAVLAADRALALAPDEPQVQLVFGSVAANQGRHAEAERAYRLALELDPQNSGAHHLLAALRLNRRTGPAGLADAAAGFANALSADPTAQVSRRSLELTLRMFLGRTAYGLFVVAYLSLLFAGWSAAWSRIVPMLLLGLPALFVVGFLHRLSPQLRSFLRHLLRRGVTAVAAGFEVMSVLLLVSGALVPQPARPAIAVAAAVTALLARLTLYRATRRLLRP